MNNAITILLQSSISIALLYLVYYLFLRKDTFFHTNRFYLVSALLLSIAVPFIDFSYLFPVHEQILLVFLDPVIITPEGVEASINANHTLFQYIITIYLTGVFIFSLRFIYQLIQLFMLTKRFGIKRSQGINIVFTDKNYSPFSFFNLLFINSRDLESPDIQKIIAHEQVHIRQWHSLDLILIEIITIILWFNPFVWMYRHVLKTLHEYLADEGVLHSGVDANVYSALLFKQSTGLQINDLTNNFSKSLLKRRFIMMTKKKTNPKARVKLLLALPLALVLMLLISFSPDIIAQQEENSSQQPQVEKQIADNTTPAVESATKKKEPEIIMVVEIPEDTNKNVIFTVVEEMPSFPGGSGAMYTYLGKNIKYPKEAQEKGISGTVYVTFVVEKDGSINFVELLRGTNKLLDDEAIRVVKAMPKWEPGKQKGKPVRVKYNLPVKFLLDEKSGDKEEKPE